MISFRMTRRSEGSEGLVYPFTRCWDYKQMVEWLEEQEHLLIDRHLLHRTVVVFPSIRIYYDVNRVGVETQVSHLLTQSTFLSIVPTIIVKRKRRRETDASASIFVDCFKSNLVEWELLPVEISNVSRELWHCWFSPCVMQSNFWLMSAQTFASQVPIWWAHGSFFFIRICISAHIYLERIFVCFRVRVWRMRHHFLSFLFSFFFSLGRRRNHQNVISLQRSMKKHRCVRLLT